MELTHAECVRNGIQWLDERWDEDRPWRELIDWDRFDIASSGSCILGQLYDAYLMPWMDAIVDLEIASELDSVEESTQKAADLGFTIVFQGEFTTQSTGWDHLQAEWEHQVRHGAAA